jgi:pimeloyl-ACP methyl ester carboxylesterase
MSPRVRIALLILVAVVVVGVVAVDYATEHILSYSPIRPYRVTLADQEKVYGYLLTPAAAGLEYSDFNVSIDDSITIKGWLVPSKTPSARGTVILLHGIANSRVSMVPMAKLMATNGFNAILYDSRANGESGGLNCTFGYYEKSDLSRVIDSAQAYNPELAPFAVFGNSLGAAVAIQALAVEPRLRCGIVESPFANLRETIHDYFRAQFLFPINAIPDRALVYSERIAHFQVDSVSPETSAQHITQPVMIVHGNKDSHINYTYGRRVFDNLQSSEKVWRLIPGGTHFNLSELGGPEYANAIVTFYQKHLASSRPPG